jgi:hypothetical protein
VVVAGGAGFDEAAVGGMASTEFIPAWTCAISSSSFAITSRPLLAERATVGGIRNVEIDPFPAKGTEYDRDQRRTVNPDVLPAAMQDAAMTHSPQPPESSQVPARRPPITRENCRWVYTA